MPKELVERENLFENKNVFLKLKKVNTVKDLFGILNNWKKPTAQIKKEMKEGWVKKIFLDT